jgi:hypothetical protein
MCKALSLIPAPKRKDKKKEMIPENIVGVAGQK